MTSSGRPSIDEMRAEIISRVMNGSTKIQTGDGAGYVWDSDSYLGVDTFLAEWFGEDWRDSIDDVDSFLEELSTEPQSNLISQLVDTGPGLSWFWTLEGITIDGYGLIFGNLSDIEYEPEFPIIAAWEPYRSDQAFEETFVALAVRHYEILGAGSEHNRGGLSEQLLHRAVTAAVSESDEYRMQVETMVEREGSGMAPDELASLWQKETWVERV